MKAKSNDTKARLQQIKASESHIENLMMELQYLESLAMKVTSVISDMPKGGGADDKLSESVMTIIAKKEEINAEIQRSINARNRMIQRINSLKNHDHSRLLYLRYIKYLPYDKIAAEMNFSVDWIYTMHGIALKAMEKCFESEEKQS